MECYDLDGTLISSYMESADKNSIEVSNQAEVVYRIMPSDFTGRLLRHRKILKVLCIVRAKYPQHRGSERRKPSPAMLIEAGATWGCRVYMG